MFATINYIWEKREIFTRLYGNFFKDFYIILTMNMENSPGQTQD